MSTQDWKPMTEYSFLTGNCQVFAQEFSQNSPGERLARPPIVGMASARLGNSLMAYTPASAHSRLMAGLTDVLVLAAATKLAGWISPFVVLFRSECRSLTDSYYKTRVLHTCVLAKHVEQVRA